MTLFENGEAIKSVILSGSDPLVSYINGHIITAAARGSVTVLDDELKVLRTYPETETLFPRTLGGNKNFIVLGDAVGAIRYYNMTGGNEPKVRQD